LALLLRAQRGWQARLRPKRVRGDNRVYANRFPPLGLVTAVVDFAMVSPAQRNGELIAYFPTERAVLCEAEVVSVRRLPTADQTRMCRSKPHTIPITNTSYRLDGWVMKAQFSY